MFTKKKRQVGTFREFQYGIFFFYFLLLLDFLNWFSIKRRLTYKALNQLA